MAPLLAKDWVDVMIDTERMTHGQEIMDRRKGDRQGGLPWMVVLDADGKELASSNKKADGANIGCPAQPDEITHFLEMLRQTKQHMSDDDVATIEAELREFAKPFQRPTRR